jgi:hypothetical protein
MEGEETLPPLFDDSAINEGDVRLAGERNRVEGRSGEGRGNVTPDGLMLTLNQGEGREAGEKKGGEESSLVPCKKVGACGHGRHVYCSINSYSSKQIVRKCCFAAIKSVFATDVLHKLTENTF